MRLLQSPKNLLTNQDLYPFNPQRVLEKLPQNSHRSFTPPTVQIPASDRTPTNSEEMTSIVKSLNQYSPNHKSKLKKVLRAINTMQGDLLIIRDSTRNLFRANMNRKTGKKKKSKGGYIPAYGRVLTEAEATRHRENEVKKADMIKQKKELAEAKKTRYRHEKVRCGGDATKQTGRMG